MPPAVVVRPNGLGAPLRRTPLIGSAEAQAPADAMLSRVDWAELLGDEMLRMRVPA